MSRDQYLAENGEANLGSSRVTMIPKIARSRREKHHGGRKSKVPNKVIKKRVPVIVLLIIFFIKLVFA